MSFSSFCVDINTNEQIRNISTMAKKSFVNRIPNRKRSRIIVSGGQKNVNPRAVILPSFCVIRTDAHVFADCNE